MVSVTIQILRPTAISGVPVSPGDLAEVDATTARLLIGYGKAMVAEAVKPEPEPDPPIEPVQETESPAPKKSRYTKRKSK